jgi:succinoglycan biosynthesis protein ExoA
MTDEALPLVTIIMPIRNEADFIERTIRSVLDNVYPDEKMEVLVVDGMSTDETREIVSRIARQDSRVKLVDNHGKIVSTGLNLALKQMRGDIFIRIDGHCEIPSDFIRKSVETLLSRPDAWVAGGWWKTISSGLVGRTISAATQSPVGVGNAHHRLGNYDGWVDTLPYGAHHRWVLDKIGYFDEQLVRNQDDEFNMRIRLAGGKIWMSREIWSIYYARSTLKKLWRQYFQYGFWRIRTIQKHKKPATARQLAPMLLVLSLLGLGIGGLLWHGFWWLLAGELLVYASGLMYGTCDVYRQEGLACAILSLLVFIILHFGYGIGCFWGFVRFVLLSGAGLPKPEEMKLSR